MMNPILLVEKERAWLFRKAELGLKTVALKQLTSSQFPIRPLVNALALTSKVKTLDVHSVSKKH